MTPKEIKSLGSELSRYLEGFRFYMGQSRIQPYFCTYVRGQLGPLERKSIEPMADAAGLAPQTLQQFLGIYDWDEDGVLGRVQRQAAARSRDAIETIGVADGTDLAKKGEETAGVKRQYCGHTGKIDNCVATVGLTYAEPEFHALIAGELYLPKDWAEDRQRCRAAGIPDDLVYRPHHEISLSQIGQAKGRGIGLDWVTADERFGEVPAYLFGLEGMNQPYVIEVPRGATGWTVFPKVLTEPALGAASKGRPLTYPRLSSHARKPRRVEILAREDRRFRRQAFTAFCVKDTDKGALVWGVKRTPFFQHRDGLPSAQALELLVAHNVLTDEWKYFVAWNPREAPLEALVRVAFSRWKVERCFEDYKSEIGMDHFEVRRYKALKRHLILSLVSGWFYESQRERLRGKKSGGHGLADSGGDGGDPHDLPLAAQDAGGVPAEHLAAYPAHPITQRKIPRVPPKKTGTGITRPRLLPLPTPPL
jgi:SRSO17 transposase